MANHIFISYSKKDSTFANKLADNLSEAGLKIWIDRSIGGGEQWRESIEQNLKAAGDVIIIVSKNSLASDWVQHEGSLAYGWGKKLYPILIDTVGNLPPWLEEYQWIDFVQPPYETAFTALVAALTPPNPVQDLLDQQVYAYQQTGELIGEAVLRVIEENKADLKINENAKTTIQKSRQKVSRNRQAKWLWGGIFSTLIILVVVVITLGATGQIAKLVYQPIPISWVTVPAGDFLMGSSEQDIQALIEMCPNCPRSLFESESPQRKIWVGEFEIGKYEITNRQYRQCVLAGECKSPRNVYWELDDYNEFPVTHVDWEDANTFCQWSGARLPTESEWEKAARGTSGSWYPWGNEPPTCSLSNIYIAAECDSLQSAQVGKYSPKGDSPFGVADMVGNVWEWQNVTGDTNTFMSSSDAVTIPNYSIESRVLKGGSYLVGEGYLLRTAFRFQDEKFAVADDYGFRCAK